MLLTLILSGCERADVAYIYAAARTSQVALKQTAFMLEKSLSDTYKIQYLQAKELIDGEWTKNAVLFVFPGGC